MEAKHMTQQVFAQFIDMSPASLSSIFNGRTKPTLNIVEAIKRKIPDISTDWLLFGNGDMYEASDGNTPTPERGIHTTHIEQTLDFDDDISSSMESPETVFCDSSLANQDVRQVSGGLRNTRSGVVREEVKYLDKPQRKVIEIRVYYDDLTYESFVPAKK